MTEAASSQLPQQSLSCHKSFLARFVMREEILLPTVVPELFPHDRRRFPGGIGTEPAPRHNTLDRWFAGIHRSRARR